MSIDKHKNVIEYIRDLTGIIVQEPLVIVTDTSNWTKIERGNIISLGGHEYIVRGNAYEQRYGISDQPKYWVFNVYDLENGGRKIIKTVFHEDFYVHIGILKIQCFRSPKKEADVLDLVRDDHRFMQGFTILDDKQNHVRIIDHISGNSLFKHIIELNKDHEEYFHEDLPGILWRLTDCLEAIRFLHKHGLCHGDIRNDHIIIDSSNGRYRWIDFDLNQYVSDFDTWSLGNVINYTTAMGIVSIRRAVKNPKIPEKLRMAITQNDASAFYNYRLMNLQKIFPYIPDSLSDILLHFTNKPKKFYTNIDELIDDYYNMLEKDFSSGKPAGFRTDTNGDQS